MSCRHCVPRAFAPSYASVALLGSGDLEASVKDVESQGIVPSVTAVCPECGKVTAIVGDSRDPYVHVVGLWRLLGAYLV